MRVELGDAAQEQLDLIPEEWEAYSPNASKKLMLQFFKRLKQLSRFPLSGEKIPELGYPQIRHVIVGPYRVLYHVHPDVIEVLGFLHTAQSWPLQSHASNDGDAL